MLKLDNVTAYAYDGEGRRVRKYVGENTRFVYGIGGELLAEYNGSSGAITKEYIYGASGLTAVVDASNGTEYLTPDHLGSPRVTTNSSASVTLRRDFMPFGEEVTTGAGRTSGGGWASSNSPRQKFTGYERDSESGLDFAEARFFSNQTGRFNSIDPMNESGSLVDPQTLNRYAYVSNDPMNSIDPSGMEECSAEYSYEQCGGDKGFWGGGPFGDKVAYDKQTLGDVTPQVQGLVGLYLERVNNSAGGLGYRTNAEVAGADAVALFDIYYEIYEDGSNRAWFNQGAITVYQWLPKGTRVANILRDVMAPVQEMALPGSTTVTNWLSQQLWGTNLINTDSAEYQDAETVTMVAGMMLPGPGGKAKAGKLAWKLAIHGSHHKFGRLGKLAHVQLNVWRNGVKNSAKKPIRIPLPSRKDFDDIVIWLHK